MRRTSDASMFMADGEPNGDTRAFAATAIVIWSTQGFIEHRDCPLHFQAYRTLLGLLQIMRCHLIIKQILVSLHQFLHKQYVDTLFVIFDVDSTKSVSLIALYADLSTGLAVTSTSKT